MRREREETAERRSPQVKRRSPLPEEASAAAWMTERRTGSRRAPRSNACEMQHSSSAADAAAIISAAASLGLVRASEEGKQFES
jgi:hypothetical protein